MARISSRVGWSVRDGINLAAIRTRRSLPTMSAVDGRALVVYHGAGAVAVDVGGVVPGDGVPGPGRRAGTGQCGGPLWRCGCGFALRRRPAWRPRSRPQCATHDAPKCGVSSDLRVVIGREALLRLVDLVRRLRSPVSEIGVVLDARWWCRAPRCAIWTVLPVDRWAALAGLLGALTARAAAASAGEVPGERADLQALRGRLTGRSGPGTGILRRSSTSASRPGGSSSGIRNRPGCSTRWSSGPQRWAGRARVSA